MMRQSEKAPGRRRNTEAAMGRSKDPRGHRLPGPTGRSLAAMLRREDARVPFGPTFFLTRLAAFVRERCPGRAEGLPAVLIHLAEGEVLDLCHVIGVAPRRGE